MKTMNMLRTLIVPAAFSLVLAVTGCSAAQPERTSEKPQKVSKTPNADTADSLLLEALRRAGDPSQALVFVKRAADKSPERADIAWLEVQLCTQTSGCEPEPLEARFRKLDPTNGAAWLNALARSQQQKDVASENQILEAISRSQRIDIYWNSLVSKIATAFGASPDAKPDEKLVDPLTQATNQAISWISSLATPKFRPLAETCNATRVAAKGTATRCARVAEVLRQSDSYIAEGVGLGISQRLALTATDAAKVNERVAVSRYQRDTAGQIIESQLERDKFTKEMLQLMSQLRREQDVFLAVIRWAQLPITPVAEQIGR